MTCSRRRRGTAVYVSTAPAELIRTKGPPHFKPIKGSNLLYVENTAGSVFYDIESRRFYVLASGRWIGSDALEGSWARVPREELPAGFRRIPAGHPQSRVFASVIQTTTTGRLKK